MHESRQVEGGQHGDEGQNGQEPADPAPARVLLDQGGRSGRFGWHGETLTVVPPHGAQARAVCAARSLFRWLIFSSGSTVR
ncbi:hypothetical protein Misp04_14560 [Micromonospora sp. NBRC 101691]|nr:hypothetical protein Misp04_14560 [Micromonospora sp. NBRC 101691]